MQKISIIGVGLIGGSIALALKNSGNAVEIIGYDRDEESIAMAKEIGAMDFGTNSLAEAVNGVDIVIIATPVRIIPKLIAEMAPFLSSGTIVTDTGSVKGDVLRKIGGLLPEEVHFIGGHPMAGAEKAGVAAADPYLFENAYYVLTPTPETPEENLEILIEMVKKIGAKPLILPVDRHDLTVAAISHLPHLLAVSLVNFAGDLEEREPGVLSLAAGGFRDTTRIASGDAKLWQDIFFANKDAILALLQSLKASISGLEEAIGQNDAERLEALLIRARKIRDSVPNRSKGLISRVFEVVVSLQDKPGELAKVTGLLASGEINIQDIEILKVREGEGGTLRMAFASEEDIANAITILRQNNYAVRRR